MNSLLIFSFNLTEKIDLVNLLGHWVEFHFPQCFLNLNLICIEFVFNSEHSLSRTRWLVHLIT